jgi:hypothetical protein
MEEAAATNDQVNFFQSFTYDENWDHDKIYGCVCDEGFEGHTCTVRTCPLGDDPLTTSQVTEIQVLKCACDTCTGTFTLKFRGKSTVAIATDATPAALDAALEGLATVRMVTTTSVEDAVSTASTTICNTAGVDTIIEFTHDSGNLPPLEITSGVTGTAVAISVVTSGTTGYYEASRDGTTESLPCSNRGFCDTSNGLCTCETDFGDSDSTTAAAGTVPNCGYYFGSGVAACASASDSVIECNGHGSCSGSPSFTCTCNAQYTGYDCALRVCPSGAAWFDEAYATDTAHADAECSNKGTCDRATGACTCDAGFEGAACNRMTCPASCSNFGACKTMAQLAKLASSNGDLLGYTYGETANVPSTWDAKMIQGCDCDSNKYTGPYAGNIVELQGHSCTVLSCPHGDDPEIYSVGVTEKTKMTCVGDGGYAKITFRQETTKINPATDTVTTLTAKLQALRSITAVTITNDASTTEICSDAGTELTIEWRAEFGDLPLPTATYAFLTATTGTPSILFEEIRAGTKANLECSARGTCDRLTGRCTCFPYFGSSDGHAGIGTRGDCGFKTEYLTTEL